ncbi:hypothetical protein A3860_06765 [Niastella vici]|uniref:Secretion system C-terminal sorting domain-containing protein n=1 Tax=Niastella vici TaxID=1703345 RepID=A0A1V9FSY7_9BACT|nr:T9SS type A sorting domain-containing protein [Niastella vici]OQP61407.1 hypothetical protein A3860_06765 [Niastella vici]
MKKFYLLIMALVCYATTIFAQPLNGDCPGTLSMQAYQISITPPFYKLWITGGPTLASTGSHPPASVSLVAANGAAIPQYTSSGTTNISYMQDNGSAIINYDGTYIDYVEINYWVGGLLKSCHYRPGAPAPLPIKLSALNGRLNTETDATITWTSSLEENSFKYEIQRSADGKTFITVGTIKAVGNSLDEVKYSFNDQLPGAGAYFYRLNMVDVDGHAELSKVVYVNSKKGAGIVTKIFPNPFNSEVQLIGATSGDLNTPGAIKVFNMSGQMVNFKVVGANAISIDPTAPKGMYFLKFRNNNSEQTFKLVKN